MFKDRKLYTLLQLLQANGIAHRAKRTICLKARFWVRCRGSQVKRSLRKLQVVQHTSSAVLYSAVLSSVYIGHGIAHIELSVQFCHKDRKRYNGLARPMGLLIKLSVQFVSKACFLGEIQRSSTIVRLTLRKLQVLHPYRNIFRQTALLNDCMNHCINHCDQPLYRWHTVTVVFLQSFS